MPWFRVDFNADGSIGSVVEVSQSGEDQKYTCFVEAANSEQACIVALKAYAKYQEYRTKNVERMRRIKQDRCSSGLCPRCGIRPPLKGAQRCNPCRIEDAVAQRKRRAGIVKKRNPFACHKKRTLREVLDKFDTLTPAKFRHWLQKELAFLADEGLTTLQQMRPRLTQEGFAAE